MFRDGTSHRYRNEVHIASKRDRKNLCISAALSQPIAWWDVLAIKKWYMRTHNPPQLLLREVRIYTRRQDDIMAFGMRRQFAAWMPAWNQAGQRWWFLPLWESQTSIHALLQTSHLLCIQKRVVELIKTEYTHKYCLFLACLQAARVWSSLKSPESGSKMSSIKIPAFHLHNVFVHCVDA